MRFRESCSSCLMVIGVNKLGHFRLQKKSCTGTMFVSSLRSNAFHSQSILRPLNRQVTPFKNPQRNIWFRRRPLYQPTTTFGRTYLVLRNFTLGVFTISLATFGAFYLLDARSAAHRYIFTPVLRLLTPDPEDAHRIAVLALKHGLHPKDNREDDPRLAVEVPFH